MGAYKDGQRVDIPGAATQKCALFAIDTDTNLSGYGYRVQSIAATGAHNFGFCVPTDFVSLASLEMVVAWESGAVGAAKDIDLYSDYGAEGEAINKNSESDTTSTYTLAGPLTWEALDISSVFSAIAAGDKCGIKIDHKGIGGAGRYFAIKMVYNTA